MDTVTKVLGVILGIIQVLLIFNIIIIVHELGHFLAARWRGLVVEQFAVWFGKPIWKKRIGGILYTLGSIPAGGFVKIPQMAAMDVIEGKADTPTEQIPPAGALDRIIVAFAGPLFSFMLAFVFAVAVWKVGKPTTESEKTTYIGAVEKGSPAEAAGLKPGDRIISIDGHPVKRFMGQVDSVTWFVIRSEGEKILFQVERDINGQKQLLQIPTGWTRVETNAFQRKRLRQVGIIPKSPLIIEKVAPNTPADKAGLQPGDEVIEVNGERAFSPYAVTMTIRDSLGKPVELGVQRKGEQKKFSIVPQEMADEENNKVPRIGIQWNPGEIQYDYLNPVEQVSQSLAAVRNTLGALASRKSDVKAQHLSSPVGIMNTYYAMLTNPDGWRLALWFSVLLNVNLAVLNLLPIPVLDGGHILLAIIEGIRRKPVSLKVQEALTTACALLLFGFMAYVAFFDVQDFSGFFGKRAKVETASPTATPAK